MPLIKLWPTKVIKLVISIIYQLLCKVCKVKSQKITFASYRATRLEDNLKYTYEELQKSGSDLQYYFLFKKYRSTIAGKWEYILHMIKACYHLATSRYFIIDDYYLPVYLIKPREETEIIQLWHAAGAFKKFGYSITGKPGGPSTSYLNVVPVHGNYSKVIVSGRYVIPFFSEAFNMASSQIYPLGLPRTDLLFDQEAHVLIKKQFYHKYPQMKDKKKILYAPTFRGKSHYQEAYHCPINLERLMKEIGEDYSLIIHLHPYMNNNIIVSDQFKSDILTKTEDFSINELMIISDLLITDYSSVIFEYSLLKKPMLFYCYDLEDYMEERDFYLNYEADLPGPLAKTTDEIIHWVVHSEKNIDDVERFSRRFFDEQDGRASRRVASLLLEGIDTHGI